MPRAWNMQMNQIIYERLRLPHSVPITYKEFFFPSFSLLQSKLAAHAPQLQTRPDQAHPQKGLLVGYYDWVGKLVRQTNEGKEG